MNLPSPPATPPVRVVQEGDTSTGDLQESKAQFLRAAAKLLGVLTVAVVPAVVTWIDAKAKASTALTATAAERATNDKSYAKLVERLNKSEDDLRRMSIEIGVLREILRGGAGTTTAAEDLRPPAPKLSTKRPEVDRADIKAAQKAIQEAY